MALPARTVVFCVSEREEDTNAAWRLFVQTALDPERDHLTFAFVNAAGFARTLEHKVNTTEAPPAWVPSEIKATLEGGLSYRNGLALDASGNVYVANAGHTTASTKILLATDTTVDLPPGVKLTTKPRFVEILSDKAVVPLLTEWLDTTFKKFADKHDTSFLVVLGSRGRGPVHAFFIGNAATAVLARSLAPCLLVRTDLPAPAAYERRLVAIAITCDATGSALCSWAAASVLRPGDDVRLLHASTGKAAPAEDADAAAAVRDGLVAATASLGGLTVAPPAALPAAGGAPCGACDAATTGPALCAWAAQHKPALMVVGTRPARGARAKPGSVALYAVAHAPCPVLVVNGPLLAALVAERH